MKWEDFVAQHSKIVVVAHRWEKPPMSRNGCQTTASIVLVHLVEVHYSSAFRQSPIALLCLFTSTCQYWIKFISRSHPRDRSSLSGWRWIYMQGEPHGCAYLSSTSLIRSTVPISDSRKKRRWTHRCISKVQVIGHVNDRLVARSLVLFGVDPWVDIEPPANMSNSWSERNLVSTMSVNENLLLEAQNESSRGNSKSSHSSW